MSSPGFPWDHFLGFPVPLGPFLEKHRKESSERCPAMAMGDSLTYSSESPSVRFQGPLCVSMDQQGHMPTPPVSSLAGPVDPLRMM